MQITNEQQRIVQLRVKRNSFLPIRAMNNSEFFVSIHHGLISGKPQFQRNENPFKYFLILDRIFVHFTFSKPKIFFLENEFVILGGTTTNRTFSSFSLPSMAFSSIRPGRNGAQRGATRRNEAQPRATYLSMVISVVLLL